MVKKFMKDNNCNIKLIDDNFDLRNAVNSLAEKDKSLFDELSADNTIVNPNQTELDNRISAIIGEHFNKESKIKKSKKLKKSIQKVAVFILILSVSFIVPFTTVDAFRTKVLNFYIDNSKTHSSFTPTEEKDNSDPIAVEYMPNGYTLEDKYKTAAFFTITYINQKNNFIDVVFYDHDTTISIDTEDSQKLDLSINNEKAYIFRKSNSVSMLFKLQGNTITIQSDDDNLSNEELMKITKKIK